MKKAVVTVVYFLFFLISKAQFTDFLSLRSTTSQKGSIDNFAPVKAWLIHETHIRFDLTKQRLQFFAKGLLDRNPLNLIKEIFIVSGTTFPDTDNGKVIRYFSGIDKAGEKCTVTFNLMKDEYKIRDGELRLEYPDHIEIYKVRVSSQTPAS